ncbi:MAG TPA: aspartate carbamoyltransferase catalytic subunit [Thermoclostridium caenicola]|uniref:Aspartate carbamoyltransferase n=1 Tax=Thermoclostridium caenicola TaxID=659425 RepID=A0A1M6EHV3_9FIRM|nr:aspartate carbamoyltransferase catalytic subunit [Thermoclostridium caenicola]SHI85011.1 aspartate carbamoyltransferase [Thermoclostridium caenicola]HOK43518.1 aspartate carbamoyltransferase catalytic subunit [Thermoclostridium caenicola]HOL85113.1 aspartate carbamoyltransferase catalytic subunit [Thermoclostridium caenicola]HOP73245.1 aspartate carbamoyltransferase catalytic subunit [Thermoclostridium caenicola]HPO77386.1 aspartate carbamoyltransferase catalytic subunit [Thermoclostridium 
MKLRSKDLLGLEHLEPDEINLILDMAKDMKKIVQSNMKRVNYLQGRSVITLFYENSTRTRVSFELAAKYMGAHAVNVSVSTSSVAKGETLIDTGKTLDVMGSDIVVIRHSQPGAPHLLAKHINASVINAGDGMHEHPTQALLDMFTMQEAKGGLEGLTVAIIGDIMHSRVARSNIIGLGKMGAKVRVFAPATLLPIGIENMGCQICSSLEEAISDADVIMGLRIQKERLKKALIPSTEEYARFFGLDVHHLAAAKKDVLVMHPGPVNRGVEMTSLLIDSDQSKINEQVTNGVAVRMALLYLLAGREEH